MSIALVWFRKDLRLTENPAFFEACTKHKIVLPLYILDGKNSTLGSAQSWWLHHSLSALKESLIKKFGLNLILRKGNPLEIIVELINLFPVDTVYWNQCYEPLASQRDKKIKVTLQENGINVQSFNASLFNEPWTITNKEGGFFKIFTPFWKACRKTLSFPSLQELTQRPARIETDSEELASWKLLPTLSWASQFSNFWTPGEEGAQQRLNEFINHQLINYKIHRDIPEKQATSRLSPHLHFGEISPWTILRALERYINEPLYSTGVELFLSELGWREFSYYLLYHVPSLSYKSYKNEFDAFPWHNDESLLKLWQKGRTGYPIVDAGLRELWATGYMHNRVRMITASFLTKGLFIDWRVGADWFLDTLVDADLANNSVNWQWVAGCGVDAAPYFRIFNPLLQSQKFDPEGTYIRRWVPELASLDNEEIHAPWRNPHTKSTCRINYSPPIINHEEARAKALSYYHQLKK
ncbi:deoxyribodipyrimidine photolyase (plasmid) [Legionella adelaidensis]|uniref:Deoxyribodipyrimidine photo-lyase n=1 Tax=Legionella adelaidensis TaxID=45056 RepID=A0A0W0R5G4_9GAMM|nr:deoxyribodipyrimidine photo-lyase [Legionella adelaidensis]KTC66274.1 deoxyribodipyrimidine photolyase [Legionella adelaidensis]VEH84870.1 deoxyribodipyrimidine photolyase [Legionella adelaidensis]